MKLKEIMGKKTFVIGGLAVIALGGGFWFYSARASKAETRYALTATSKNTIVTTVDGTGQVSGDRQLDVKSKAGGEVTKILVKVGDKVTKGTQLIEVDRTEALKTIRDASQSVNDAKLSLDNARLQLAKTQADPDAVTLAQTQNSLNQAKRNLADLQKGADEFDLQQAKDDVENAKKNIEMSADGTMPQNVRDTYDQYVLSLQSAYQTLSKSLSDANNILGIDGPRSIAALDRMFSILDDSAKYKSMDTYSATKTSMETAEDKVNSLALTNEKPDNIEAAAEAVSDALNQANVMLRNVSDGLQATMVSSDLSQSQIDSLKSSIQSDQANVNSKITAILNQDQTIRQAYDSYDSSVNTYNRAVLALEKLQAPPDASQLTTAEEKVKEAQAQLDKLLAGPTAIDLKLSQNSVDQRVSALSAAQNKLSDAQKALTDYSVVAPFDGVIGSLTAQPNVDISAGGTAVTMITNQKIATVALNEVDAAKVAVGQKATLTFDAIEGLSITGEVAEVSPLATVSQGVVSYNVKIAFDTQDDRIKSGMSVSTSIVTEVKADVLTVPNSAVKSQSGQYYVQTLANTSSTNANSSGLVTSNQTPVNVPVTTGVTNGTLTEITSGLKEGDQVITQTIKSTSQSSSTASSQSSLLKMGGATTGAARAGGAMMMR
ncbi:MAG: efflux RND transporter periplasmic adaptor subunit [Patescibacteria group bacterium]|nr:efflux RND transporter periplasmic adaptor subunit [Patescibacteria group bacterium]